MDKDDVAVEHKATPLLKPDVVPEHNSDPTARDAGEAAADEAA